MPKKKKQIIKATATEIETRLIRQTTVYTKPCPWGINYVDQESETEHIIRVGHKKCCECPYYIGVKDNQVYCKDE